jgi:hypothetical protein
LSLPTVSPAKKTKHTGGKTPKKVNHPDNNDAPAEPDDDVLDDNCADKQNDDNSNRSSDEGNVLGF